MKSEHREKLQRAFDLLSDFLLENTERVLRRFRKWMKPEPWSQRFWTTIPNDQTERFQDDEQCRS